MPMRFNLSLLISEIIPFLPHTSFSFSTPKTCQGVGHSMQRVLVVVEDPSATTPRTPTHAKNLSPRPPISPAASKDHNNLSASLADCYSFSECAPAPTHRGQRGSQQKPDKSDSFLPAWKRKSLNEIERIKSRKEGEMGLQHFSDPPMILVDALLF